VYSGGLLIGLGSTYLTGFAGQLPILLMITLCLAALVALAMAGSAGEVGDDMAEPLRWRDLPRLMGALLARAGAFVAGGLIVSLSNIASVQAGARFSQARLPLLTTALTICYALGSSSGAAVGGAAIQLLGPSGLPAAIGGVLAIAAAAMAVAAARRWSLPATLAATPLGAADGHAPARAPAADWQRDTRPTIPGWRVGWAGQTVVPGADPPGAAPATGSGMNNE
jgi:hypothetical protein